MGLGFGGGVPIARGRGDGSLQGRSGRVALPRVKDRLERLAGWERAEVVVARRAERKADVRRAGADMVGGLQGFGVRALD